MKLFKRKQQVKEQDELIPYDIPATYGAEYDEYDYFYANKPSDSVEWQWYYCKCEFCGKYHRLNLCSSHYFYSLDGYDSMSYIECWKCRLKDKIYAIRAKIKRKMKAKKEYRNWIKQFKKNGIKITTDLKKKTIAMVSKEIIR